MDKLKTHWQTIADPLVLGMPQGKFPHNKCCWCCFDTCMPQTRHRFVLVIQQNNTTNKWKWLSRCGVETGHGTSFTFTFQSPVAFRKLKVYWHGYALFPWGIMNTGLLLTCVFLPGLNLHHFLESSLPIKENSGYVYTSLWKCNFLDVKIPFCAPFYFLNFIISEPYSPLLWPTMWPHLMNHLSVLL